MRTHPSDERQGGPMNLNSISISGYALIVAFWRAARLQANTLC
jgi:hypothetical protein